MSDEEMTEVLVRYERLLLEQGDPLCGDDWEMMQIVRGFSASRKENAALRVALKDAFETLQMDEIQRHSGISQCAKRIESVLYGEGP